MSEEKSIKKILESFDETERNGILGVVLDFLNAVIYKAPVMKKII